MTKYEDIRAISHLRYHHDVKQSDKDTKRENERLWDSETQIDRDRETERKLQNV